MYRRHQMNPELAAYLAHKRKEAGLSQAEVALRLGCSESTVMRLETLRSPCSPEMRERFERVLNEASR